MIVKGAWPEVTMAPGDERAKMSPVGSGPVGKVLGTPSSKAAQARKGACPPYALRGT